MSAQDEPPLGGADAASTNSADAASTNSADATSTNSAEQDTGQKVARVAEGSLSAVSGALSIGAVAAAVEGAIPIVGPLVAVGVTGLLPVVVAAFERRREANSKRARRARSYADEAWNAVTTAHGG
jgi:hypothetical protein